MLLDDVPSITVYSELPEALRKLQREQQLRPAVHQPLWTGAIKAELRVHGEIEAPLLLVYEAPLNAEVSVAGFGVRSGISPLHQQRDLEFKLGVAGSPVVEVG